jgi:hypothetical protein
LESPSLCLTDGLLQSHRLAGLFPATGADGVLALAADIEAHGQREPVVLLENQILDGRSRVAACQVLGIAPRCRAFDPGVDGDPFSYVISVNLARRHLSVAQRKEVAKQLILANPSRTDAAIAQLARLSYVVTLRLRREVEAETPEIAEVVRISKDGRRGLTGRPRGSQPRRPHRWIKTLDRHFAEDAGAAIEAVVPVVTSYDEPIRQRLSVERRRELAMQFARALGIEEMAVEWAA